MEDGGLISIFHLPPSTFHLPPSAIHFPTSVCGLRSGKDETNMLFMEPFWIMMDMISGAARDEDEKRTDPSYVQCLYCRGYVEKRMARERGGCYLCGTPGEEMARIAKRQKENREPRKTYRTKCPNCGATVVTKELREKGCYVCGWSPIDEEKPTED